MSAEGGFSCADNSKGCIEQCDLCSGAPFGRCSRCNRPLPHTEPEQRACAAMETNGEERPEDTARRYARIISQLEDLIAHARLVSPSERAVIYVADLERALGIDAPVPHKLGGNDA